MHKASVFAGWRSTTQQFSTEQMERDRKSDTDLTLKHPVYFRIKHSVLTPEHILLNFINKHLLCAEPGLKSTDQRFSEAADTLNLILPVQDLHVTVLESQICETEPAAQSKASLLKTEWMNWLYVRNKVFLNASCVQIVASLPKVKRLLATGFVCERACFTSSCPPPAPPHLEMRRCRRTWTCPDGCHVWSRPLSPPPSPAPCGTNTAPGKTAPRAPAVDGQHSVTLTSALNLSMKTTQSLCCKLHKLALKAFILQSHSMHYMMEGF